MTSFPWRSMESDFRYETWPPVLRNLSPVSYPLIPARNRYRARLGKSYGLTAWIPAPARTQFAMDRIRLLDVHAHAARRARAPNAWRLPA